MMKIPLSQGKFAVIDEVDSDLAQLRWYANYHDKNWYARRNQSTKGGQRSATIRQHRLILERILGRPLERGEIVDHINRNGLDNRRSNLRLATAKISTVNRHKFAQYGDKPTTSRYRGVTWHRGKSRWHAQIRVDRKLHHLGDFDQEIDAAKAYNKAAKGFLGPFAEVNSIPDLGPGACECARELPGPAAHCGFCGKFAAYVDDAEFEGQKVKVFFCEKCKKETRVKVN